jgi:hypothetical protein
MPTRRTTLAADSADLAVLEREARRRGVSLAQVLREVVGREADELRGRRRPHLGIARSGGRSPGAAALPEEEPAATPFRS